MQLLKIVLLISVLLSNVSKADQRFGLTSQDYAPTTDWSKVDSASTLSMFVYQDRNINGVYDLGDIAMSGVVVRLEKIVKGRVNEKISKSKTNGIGFANFKAWVHEPYAVIRTPGLYKFIVSVPPGWRVTSANEKQTVSIVSKPETRSELFLKDRMIPVGLAPKLWIGGTVDSESATQVELRDKQGVVIEERVVDDGQFYFDVDPGRYEVFSGDVSQSVEVTNLPTYIGKLGNGGDISSQSRTATFEDLPQHGIYKTPAGYLGLNWQDLNTIRRDYTSGVNEGYVNGVISGNHVAYTSQSRHGEISSNKPFDFVRVYLSLGWLKAEGQEVLIEMWRDEEKVVADKIRLSALGPIEYAPRVSNVTRVRFSPVRGWQVVLDNLTIASCDGWLCRL